MALLSTRAARGLRASYAEISRCVRAMSARQPVMLTGANKCFHTSRTLKSTSPNLKDKPFIANFKQAISFPAATHEIRSLDELPLASASGQRIVLHGYLGSRHNLSKKLTFIPLISNDFFHCVQIVSAVNASSEVERKDQHERIKELAPNTPVVITGSLNTRENATDKDLGDIKKIRSKEVELISVQPLNEFPKDIIIDPETVFSPEQRHLEIRQEHKLRLALQKRSQIAQVCRSWLEDRGFQNVETPLLFKSTPEGAREFTVPTRRKGYAYSLPQSPQQFKQILMGSGIPRYYQFARCFRDEDLRADRQPEFTQLDLEMAFTSGAGVMDVIESLVKEIWKVAFEGEDGSAHQLPQTFPRMTYHEAVSTYGSDKPDTRFDMKLHRFDHLLPVDLTSKISSLNFPAVDAMKLPLSTTNTEPQAAREFIGKFLESTDGQQFVQNDYGAPGIFIYDTTKPLSGLQPFGFKAAEAVEGLLGPVDGDIIVLQARPQVLSGGSTAIGNLRLALQREAAGQGLVHPLENQFKPLWITDFPLFSPAVDSEPGQRGLAGLASTHHPFTSPKTEDDVDRLVDEPEKVIADHYDLVMNGVELGGGSRRIHNWEMQRYIMKDVLKMSEDGMAEFSHLLEVLRAGCPPHAGIALGFDRLMAVILGRESVRDTIAFPKSGRGEDLLVKSPGLISEETLSTYHLKLR